LNELLGPTAPAGKDLIHDPALPYDSELSLDLISAKPAGIYAKYGIRYGKYGVLLFAIGRVWAEYEVLC
jgi:hypothetical protein